MTIIRPDRPSIDDLAELYAHPVGPDESGAARPWVRLNFVTTVDGSVTGAEGVSGDLGGPADHDAYTAMRNACDVVLVGAGTARDEEYGRITSDSVDTARRRAAGLAPVPALAIVSARLDVPDALLGEGTVVVTTTRAAADPGLDADLVPAGDGEIDWLAVLAAFADRGWHRVLCEGGPHLAGTLAAADLVDEVCLTVAPDLAGGDGPRLTHGAPSLGLALRLQHVVVADDVLLTRWLRDRTDLGSRS